ncbi:MAG: hypothetical protein ABSC50_09420 [Candidatus Bathyarchaeia archaeon]
MAITGKVTTLITAEAIIAGFMIAYGALNGQMLTYWRDQTIGTSTNKVITTYLVGVWIYGIVITCFASILLLYSSIDKSDTDRRYKAGYWLFSGGVWVFRHNHMNSRSLVECLFLAPSWDWISHCMP